MKEYLLRMGYDGVTRKAAIMGELIRCKDCKYYKPSAVASRKMCFRKDVDGVQVCYDFLPSDFCSYGERRLEACHDDCDTCRYCPDGERRTDETERCR